MARPAGATPTEQSLRAVCGDRAKPRGESCPMRAGRLGGRPSLRAKISWGQLKLSSAFTTARHPCIASRPAKRGDRAVPKSTPRPTDRARSDGLKAAGIDEYQNTSLLRLGNEAVRALGLRSAAGAAPLACPAEHMPPTMGHVGGDRAFGARSIGPLVSVRISRRVGRRDIRPFAECNPVPAPSRASLADWGRWAECSGRPVPSLAELCRPPMMRAIVNVVPCMPPLWRFSPGPFLSSAAQFALPLGPPATFDLPALPLPRIAKGQYTRRSSVG